jgi:hypothetical protein
VGLPKGGAVITGFGGGRHRRGCLQDRIERAPSRIQLRFRRRAHETGVEGGDGGCGHGGPAGVAGTDVIVEIDRKPVSSAEEAVAMLRQGGEKQRLLRLRSGRGSRFVTIAPQ